jgi:hypothetical protein
MLGLPRRGAFLFAVVLVQVGVVAACSDPAPKPGAAVVGNTPTPNIAGGSSEGGADSGTEGGKTVVDSGDGGVCNDVAITGVLVDRTAVVGEPPVATGGTIADGIYDLTLDTVYVGAGGVGGPTGITVKATLRIAGGKLDEHIQIGGTGKTTTDTTSSSVFTATGATLAATDICPAGGGGKQLQFTALDTSVTLTDVTLKEAFTFTKR